MLEDSSIRRDSLAFYVHFKLCLSHGKPDIKQEIIRTKKEEEVVEEEELGY